MLEQLPSAAELCIPELVHLVSATSTMDEAHARASGGALAGTIIVADEQTAGRGRGGNPWKSSHGSGLWFTLIERPAQSSSVQVLSLRLGLALADAVQPLARDRVQVKWPNDLYLGHGKLAGILVEARWREGSLEWVAIGIGLNLRLPDVANAASTLRSDVSRSDVLRAILPSLRRAASQDGPLSDSECEAWVQRDLCVGREVVAPIPGGVRGIASDGALLIERADGVIETLRSGSLVFADRSVIAEREASC